MKATFFDDATEHEHTFTQLYTKLHPRVRSLAEHYIRTPQESEDITTDAFVKAWNRRSDFKSEEKLLSFLKTVVRNACIDTIRRRGFHKRYLNTLRHSDSYSTPPVTTFDKKLPSVVVRTIPTLPPQCKYIFQLTLHGYTVREIADRLQLAQQTVRNQQGKAIKILRRSVIK